MIFVSKGYFKSTNCLREADCTVKQNKHITLMHDPVKGGATLDFIKENECPERLLKPIFTCPDGVTPRKVITWHRIKDFQLVSLKLLTEQMLLGCATYANLPELPLYLPGEISAKKLMFSKKVRCHTAAPKRSHTKCSHSEYSYSPTRTPTPASLACVQVVMYASPNNPGAEKVAEMLKRRQPGLLTTRLPPDLGKFGKEDDKTIFSSVFDSVSNLTDSVSNFAESLTGLDVDGDGDVGMNIEEAARARQLLETGDSEATFQGQRAKIRADSLDGYEVPTIMLLYLNGEAPPCSPHSPPHQPRPPPQPRHPPLTPFSHTRAPCLTPLHPVAQARPTWGRRGPSWARRCSRPRRRASPSSCCTRTTPPSTAASLVSSSMGAPRPSS